MKPCILNSLFVELKIATETVSLIQVTVVGQWKRIKMSKRHGI